MEVLHSYEANVFMDVIHSSMYGFFVLGTVEKSAILVLGELA
jgi:hypothetical protein